jgi:hypothetical protein
MPDTRRAVIIEGDADIGHLIHPVLGISGVVVRLAETGTGGVAAVCKHSTCRCWSVRSVGGWACAAGRVIECFEPGEGPDRPGYPIQPSARMRRIRSSAGRQAMACAQGWRWERSGGGESSMLTTARPHQRAGLLRCHSWAEAFHPGAPSGLYGSGDREVPPPMHVPT